jgi:DNA-binding transcriptional LysR family regulator
MPRLSLDQVSVFLAIVEHGSFLGAARTLNRAQSAISYAIKGLEEDVGAQLFDRNSYRASLTEAGRSLLHEARRVADAVSAFETRARALSRDEEAEVALVVDSIFPMQLVRDGLRAFSEAFPGVVTRLHVEPHSATSRLLLDKTCTLGLLNPQSLESSGALLIGYPALTVELIPVVAAAHPLAHLPSPIPVEQMQESIRLVLGTRREDPQAQSERFYGALWFVNDIAAKRQLLLTGVGWGIMPVHMIGEDLAEGRLVRLKPAKWDYPPQTDPAGGVVNAQMYATHRAGETLGRASQWLLDYFVGAANRLPAAASLSAARA